MISRFDDTTKICTVSRTDGKVVRCNRATITYVPVDKPLAQEDQLRKDESIGRTPKKITRSGREVKPRRRLDDYDC